HGCDDRQRGCGSGAARYLLRRRALPLRPVARRRVRHLRGLVLLVPEDDRLHVLGVLGQAALLADLHWRQHSVLPAALLGSGRHAAALCRLSGRLRLLELCVLDGLVHHSGWYAGLLRRHGSGAAEEGAGRGKSLGCWRNDAGVDAVLAAAVPLLRDAAADPGSRASLSQLSSVGVRGQGLRAPIAAPAEITRVEPIGLAV